MSQQQFRYQSYQPQRPTRSTAPIKPSPRRLRRALAMLSIVTIGVVSVMLLLTHVLQSSVKAVDFASLLAPFSEMKPKPVSTIPASLGTAVNAIIKQNSQAQIGVALEDIATGETKTYGSTAQFEAASTAKLITAAAYYHMVETGTASLSTPMGAYDAEFQIKEMVNDSDNDAWSLLTAAVTDEGLASYAQSIGVNYSEDGNELSPAAMATFLTKLYSGKLLNQKDTNQLLSYMQGTNDETLIPAALPTDITVYHKYGLLNGELHDAAILTQGDKSYALVIYTKNTDDSDDAQRTTVIHQITSSVVSSIFGE